MSSDSYSQFFFFPSFAPIPKNVQIQFYIFLFLPFCKEDEWWYAVILFLIAPLLSNIAVKVVCFGNISVLLWALTLLLFVFGSLQSERQRWKFFNHTQPSLRNRQHKVNKCEERESLEKRRKIERNAGWKIKNYRKKQVTVLVIKNSGV